MLYAFGLAGGSYKAYSLLAAEPLLLLHSTAGSILSTEFPRPPGVTYADTLRAAQPRRQPSLAFFPAVSCAERLAWPPPFLSFPIPSLPHFSAFLFPRFAE